MYVCHTHTIWDGLKDETHAIFSVFVKLVVSWDPHQNEKIFFDYLCIFSNSDHHVQKLYKM